LFGRAEIRCIRIEALAEYDNSANKKWGELCIFFEKSMYLEDNWPSNIRKMLKFRRYFIFAIIHLAKRRSTIVLPAIIYTISPDHEINGMREIPRPPFLYSKIELFFDQNTFYPRFICRPYRLTCCLKNRGQMKNADLQHSADRLLRIPNMFRNAKEQRYDFSRSYLLKCICSDP
jgi:hypothetical protein